MRKPKNLEIEMEPEILAGQMVLTGFDGTRLTKPLKEALAAGRLAGVILFGRNIENPKQLRKLTDGIREASPYPPIIAVDHEGGRVQRLKGPFTQWPAARLLGRRGDPDLAREVAMAMAAELLAVGINTNLAPVLDVDSNPDNPVIGDRALGSDAAMVAKLGSAMIAGFNQAGMVSCGKHFPGHGDTREDSHSDVALVEADRSTLERRELRPFYEAIRADAPMLMAGHLKAPALDKYYPATISRKVLYDLLRDEMGFEGVIMTDDLEMNALSQYMPLADAVFSSVRAGADLLLVCSGLEAGLQAHQTLVEGARQGVLQTGELAAAALRVLALKEEKLMDSVPPSTAIAYTIGKDDHLELARKFSA